MKDQRKNDSLKFFIVLILGGTLFDLIGAISPIVFSELWIDIHLFLKDLMFVGFAGLIFLQTPYRQLKLKTFSFMLTLWRTVVLVLNATGLYYPKIIIALYALYFLWIIRIYLINDDLARFTSVPANVKSYNVFVPVNTFRGLLKVLFVFWDDPRYETTILVNDDKMFYVKNKLFFQTERRQDALNKLIKNTNAKVLIKNATPKRIKDIKALSYKNVILGFRDCRLLRI